MAVAAAARPALPGENRQEIEAIIAEAGGTALTPAPLGAPAVATLVEARLGAAPVPEFVAAVVEATGGNALLVDDLLRAEVAAAPERGPRSSRPSARSASPAASRG